MQASDSWTFCAQALMHVMWRSGIITSLILCLSSVKGFHCEGRGVALDQSSLSHLSTWNSGDGMQIDNGIGSANYSNLFSMPTGHFKILVAPTKRTVWYVDELYRNNSRIEFIALKMHGLDQLTIGQLWLIVRSIVVNSMISSTAKAVWKPTRNQTTETFQFNSLRGWVRCGPDWFQELIRLRPFNTWPLANLKKAF